MQVRNFKFIQDFWRMGEECTETILSFFLAWSSPIMIISVQYFILKSIF